MNLLENTTPTLQSVADLSTLLIHYSLFAYRTAQYTKGLKLAERALALTSHPTLWILIFLGALALGRTLLFSLSLSLSVSRAPLSHTTTQVEKTK
jgi:hypothetical protein